MLLHWMIFSALASGLFYGLYCLTLRRDRRLRMSEWYLMLTLGFSMAFPYFSLPEVVSSATLPAIAAEDYWMNLSGIESEIPPSRSFLPSWQTILAASGIDAEARIHSRSLYPASRQRWYSGSRLRSLPEAPQENKTKPVSAFRQLSGFFISQYRYFFL